MKELLTYVAQHLVEHPEQVSVTETCSGSRWRSSINLIFHKSLLPQ